MADQTITISSEQQKALEDAIRNNVKPMGAVDTFCGTWSTAKPVLDQLRNIIALVPGVSVFAGTAITVVIAAGDAAFAAICKKT
jgi:hypothetical protein